MDLPSRIELARLFIGGSTVVMFLDYGAEAGDSTTTLHTSTGVEFTINIYNRELSNIYVSVLFYSTSMLICIITERQAKNCVELN